MTIKVLNQADFYYISRLSSDKNYFILGLNKKMNI